MRVLFICSFLLLNLKSNSQVLDKKELVDSLIVNVWKTETVKVNDKFVAIDDNQKSSRLIFHKNHNSENKYNGFNERGKWQIDSKKMVLKLTNINMPDEEPLVFKIILLVKDRFIFSITDENSKKSTEFECVPEKL